MVRATVCRQTHPPIESVHNGGDGVGYNGGGGSDNNNSDND